jgi:hypothetical protein
MQLSSQLLDLAKDLTDGKKLSNETMATLLKDWALNAYSLEVTEIYLKGYLETIAKAVDSWRD